MIDLQHNIIHRKPRPDAMKGAEWILAYLPHNKLHPFVVATLTPDTAAHNEWVHGTYCETYLGAKQVFDARPEIPKGVDAWKAAGIANELIELWFECQIEDMRECAKDLAHQDADNTSVAEMRAWVHDMDDENWTDEIAAYMKFHGVEREEVHALLQGEATRKATLECLEELSLGDDPLGDFHGRNV